MQERRGNLGPVNQSQALLVPKENGEQLEDLGARGLKEKKEKRGSLGWSMFAGEEPRVLVVLRLFTKVESGNK